jgi:hypothetical protein
MTVAHHSFARVTETHGKKGECSQYEREGRVREKRLVPFYISYGVQADSFKYAVGNHRSANKRHSNQDILPGRALPWRI